MGAGKLRVERRSICFSECGPVRSRNADAVRADDALGLYAVADGVGSTEASAAGSRAAIAEVFRVYAREAANGPVPRHRLPSLVREAYVAYRQDFSTRPPIPSTTLTLAAFGDAEIHYVSIGDSPLFIIEGSRVRLATRRHTLIDQDRTFASFSELKSFRGSNVLVNTFGPQIPEIMEYEPLVPADRCRVLICSDGLLDFLEQDELGTLSARNGTLERFVQEMIEAASNRTAYDNYSAAVIEIHATEGR